jgi:SAM-dependent methyltransferase
LPRIDSELFYTNAIKKHGLSPEGVCWLSYHHQQIRFETICELLPKDLANFTLTDAGCGFGDFYTYLKRRSNLPKRYIGIDSMPTMCEIAKQKTGETIIQTDITNHEIFVSDYVICSGAMSVLTPFETVSFINNCYKAAKRAFIFNILHGEDNSQTYNYLTKEKITVLARELKVKDLYFKEGYLKDDITVGFFR